MKKRDLDKQLRNIAKDSGRELLFVREGANHEVWTLDGERLILPRHRELNDHTAQEILKRARKVIDHDTERNDGNGVHGGSGAVR